MTAKKTVKSENTEAGKGPMIYIGPSLPNGLLLSNTVFSGELPANAKTALLQCPAVKFLIVPVADLTRSQAGLADRASLLSAKYQETRKFFSKGANKL